MKVACGVSCKSGLRVVTVGYENAKKASNAGDVRQDVSAVAIFALSFGKRMHPGHSSDDKYVWRGRLCLG